MSDEPTSLDSIVEELRMKAEARRSMAHDRRHVDADERYDGAADAFDRAADILETSTVGCALLPPEYVESIEAIYVDALEKGHEDVADALEPILVESPRSVDATSHIAAEDRLSRNERTARVAVAIVCAVSGLSGADGVVDAVARTEPSMALIYAITVLALSAIGAHNMMIAYDDMHRAEE